MVGNKNADSADSAEEIEDEIAKLLQSENPFNRVGRLYRTNPFTADKYGESTVCSGATSLCAMIVGGVVFSFAAQDAKRNYKAANVATAYKTRFIANRRAMDAYMLGGVKKGGKWGLITALAVSSFSHLSQAIELYRLKTSSANYAVAGTLLGGLSRFPLGPKGMLAGCFLGGYFGVVVGFITTNMMIFHGVNIEKRFYDETRLRIEERRYCERQSAEVSARLELNGESKKPVQSG